MRFHELARVTVPSMGIGEEWSTLALDPDPLWASWQARQHSAFQGHPNYRVDVRGTNHQSFGNLYSAFTIMLNRGLLDQATYDWLMDEYFNIELPSDESNRLTAKYAVAFLKTVLAANRGIRVT